MYLKKLITASVICILYLFVHSGFGQAANSLIALPTSLNFKENTIFQETSKTEKYRILSRAIEISDLGRILDADGQYTLLAPSNKVFNKILDIQSAKILNEADKAQLRKILTNHIISGKITAAKLLQVLASSTTNSKLITLRGSEIYFSLEGTDIILSDGNGQKVKILEADLQKSNGVIHEVDGLLGV